MTDVSRGVSRWNVMHALRRAYSARQVIDEIKADVALNRAKLDEILAAQAVQAEAAGWLERVSVVTSMQGAAIRAEARYPDVEAPQPMPLETKPFDALAREYPLAYPKWKELFDRGASEYEASPDDNLSVGEHKVALRFASFVAGHCEGVVLDIGCGPQPIANYLQGYPCRLMAGMDPLISPTGHPFVFAEGVAEQIPWADNSFDTAIVATSLDHVIDLRKSLSEIARVLRPGGQLLLWAGYLDSGQEYDPYTPPNPPDEYHLFHLHPSYLDPLMMETFDLGEKWQASATDFFYVWRLRDDT